LHALSCTLPSAKASRTTKHHKVKHGIAHCARRVQADVEVEFPICAVTRLPTDRHMDLVVRNLVPTTLHLDVGIVGPSEAVRRGDALTREVVEAHIERLRGAQEARVAADAAADGRGQFAIRSPDEDTIRNKHANAIRIAARRMLIDRHMRTYAREKTNYYAPEIREMAANADVEQEFRPLIFSSGGTTTATTRQLLATLSNTQVLRDGLNVDRAGDEERGYTHAASALRNLVYQILSRQFALQLKSFFNNGMRRMVPLPPLGPSPLLSVVPGA
jgi:hypothetical protein